MTEPLTDEEFEELKKEFANGDYRGFCPEGRIRSLIATVEEKQRLINALREHMDITSWKNKEQVLAQRNLALKEENAKLKAELEGFKNKRFSLGGPMI